jgi:hypothetical protein
VCRSVRMCCVCTYARIAVQFATQPYLKAVWRTESLCVRGVSAGGDMRSSAFHGAVRAPLQRLQQQRGPRRHEGARPRRRRPTRQIP